MIPFLWPRWPALLGQGIPLWSASICHTTWCPVCVTCSLQFKHYMAGNFSIFCQFCWLRCCMLSVVGAGIIGEWGGQFRTLLVRWHGGQGKKALKVDAGPHTLQRDRKCALLRNEEPQCNQLCIFKFPCTCTNAIFLLTMQDTWNNKGSSLFIF